MILLLFLSGAFRIVQRTAENRSVIRAGSTGGDKRGDRRAAEVVAFMSARRGNAAAELQSALCAVEHGLAGSLSAEECRFRAFGIGLYGDSGDCGGAAPEVGL